MRAVRMFSIDGLHVFVYTRKQRFCPQEEEKEEEEDGEAALKEGLSQHVLFMLSGRCLCCGADKCPTLLASRLQMRARAELIKCLFVPLCTIIIFSLFCTF